MQTRRQSRLEVGVDLGVSLLINVVTQGLFYGALATAGQSLAFTAMVLGLAVPRRYAIRRLFNARLAPGTRQSRTQSWCEVGVDTVLAILIAILLQRCCYGTAATWSKASAVTVALYAITMGRRYVLRRLFETWHGRQAARSPYNPPMSSGLSSSPR
jgi:hypothetical protein